MNPIRRLLERRSLRQVVRRALDRGTGLYHTNQPVADAATETLARELLDWCREVLGKMHRPYGVDSVSLAIALLGKDGRPLASTHYPLLHPIDFYDGPVESELRGTLGRWADDGLFHRPPGHLSVVLFSWGDLTQELLLAA